MRLFKSTAVATPLSDSEHDTATGASTGTDTEAEGVPASGARAVLYHGVQWSPDGSCLLTCHTRESLAGDTHSELQVYDSLITPADASFFECPSASGMPAELSGPSARGLLCHDRIYDYVWYPWMSSADPPTCGILCAQHAQPLRLVDGFTGASRASYSLDDRYAKGSFVHPVSCNFVSFANQEKDNESAVAHAVRMAAGFANSTVALFDPMVPGSSPVYARRLKLDTAGHAGLARTPLATALCSLHGSAHLFAAGCTDGSIRIYDQLSPANQPAMVLQGHFGGVVQMVASGLELFSVSRSPDPRVCVWDIRTMRIMTEVHRPGILPSAALKSTSLSFQRMQISLSHDGQTLYTGNRASEICAFDMRSARELNSNTGSEDAVTVSTPSKVYSVSTNLPSHHCINGVSVCPIPGYPLIACASGERWTEGQPQPAASLSIHWLE
eukprot:ANDGO_06370.mRNA.1 hypothetical protein PPTG_13174